MPMHRTHSLERAQRAADTDDLIVDMAFASGEPYERWWGVEILDVKGARLGRLNDGAPLLFNHDWNDLRGVHVPGSVRADTDGVMRGQVRITSATQAGRDTIALVDTKVLTKASIGYQIITIVEKSTGKSGEQIERTIDGATFERLLEAHGATRDANGFRRALDGAVGKLERAGDSMPTYIVTDFEPLENSFVTVPADNTVGVGRSAQQGAAQLVSQPPAATAALERKATMNGANQAAAGAIADDGAAQQRASTVPMPTGTPGNTALQMEQARRQGIENLCKAMHIDDNIRDHFIGTGMSIAEISNDLLQIQQQRGQQNPKSVAALDLTAGEAKRYSLMAAIRACADKNWTNAGFELECSREIAKRQNTVLDPNKFFVPFEIQGRQVQAVNGSLMTGDARRAMGGYARRDLTAGTGSAGGFLVATENMSFIEILRNRSVAYRMGARRMAGMVGNVTIPRQTAAATAVWLANEASTATESQQTLGQLSLSPKTVGAYTEISRQLMLQSSPDAEAMVTSDLGSVCSLAVDVGALRGSGSSGEPTGIVNTAGIGAVAGAGFLAAAYGRTLEFQTDVATGNVMPMAGGYVTTPLIAAEMMQRVKFPSTASPIWEGNVWDGSMAGFSCMSTNQMAAATMLFGDWAQLVVAEWGVLQIEVNPYANFQAGIIGVRAMVSVDVGLRYAAAFSLASSIA
jgi:HK97 family phage major capsid protein